MLDRVVPIQVGDTNFRIGSKCPEAPPILASTHHIGQLGIPECIMSALRIDLCSNQAAITLITHPPISERERNKLFMLENLPGSRKNKQTNKRGLFCFNSLSFQRYIQGSSSTAVGLGGEFIPCLVPSHLVTSDAFTPSCHPPPQPPQTF